MACRCNANRHIKVIGQDVQYVCVSMFFDGIKLLQIASSSTGVYASVTCYVGYIAFSF